MQKGVFIVFGVHSVQPVLSGHLGAGYIGERNILALVRSQKADHPSAICFLYSVYMQKVVLGSSARKILALCKLPSLGWC